MSRCHHPHSHTAAAARTPGRPGRLGLAGLAGLALTVVIALAAGTASSTSSPSAAGSPLEISSASLTQSGQALEWRVQLVKPFSPTALARAHRSLCLLIGPADTGAAGSRLCVAGGGRFGQARLMLSRVTAAGTGPAKAIPGTITRSSPAGLTARFSASTVAPSYRPVRWQVSSTQSRPACVSSPARVCSVRFPAQPRLLVLHVPRVVGCVASGSSEVFNGRSARREIALTFDDGPGTTPPAMDFVNVLTRLHAPATFFEIGRQIRALDRSGRIGRAMLAAGDMIGVHAWTHPIMTTLAPSAQRAELTRTLDAIRQQTGFAPCLWRPPYGAVDARLISLARRLGLLTVMWDVDPRDWARPGTRTIVSRVVTAAHNGAIVIQHFGGGPRDQTLAALPHEITALRGAGYRLVTVAQLLGLRLIYR